MNRHKSEILAIIPARGASKGFPRKNIRFFTGHLLIAYSNASGLQVASAESPGKYLRIPDASLGGGIKRVYESEQPRLRSCFG